MKNKEIEKLLDAMSHSFYQVHNCLENNLPDCDEEYEDECLSIFESSLEEFKNAEEAMRKLLCVEK